MTDEELIVEYLRNRDVPCPGCHYNLRGIAGRICPECGEAFRLQLVRTGAATHDPKHERLRLADYLRDRDVQCPSCGTNLRGHDELFCPGCGLELSVWLLTPRGLAGARNARGTRSAAGLIAIIILLSLLWAVVVVILLWP